MNKQCEIVQDLLPLYVDSICSQSSIQLVEEHLPNCSECTEMRNRLKNKNCEDVLCFETQSVIARHAKAQKRKTFVVGSCIAGILCIPIIVCLIVNLAVGHALDWFFIVLTSLMVFASLVIIPLIVEKQKGLWTIGTFTVSLMLLLLVCAIFTKGDWFWVASSSVLFGLSVLLMPYIAYKAPLGNFWKRHKGLLVFATDTILLIVMLLCIGIFVKDPMYWKSMPPILLFTVGFVWVFFLICRYLIVSKFIRAGINCILTGGFLFSVDYVINLIVGNNPDWPVMDLKTWTLVTADGNSKWMMLICLVIIGVVLIGIGLTRTATRDEHRKMK